MERTACGQWKSAGRFVLYTDSGPKIRPSSSVDKKDNGILARITGLSVLKMDVEIEPKGQVSINSSHRKPVQFTTHESFLLCETITEAVFLHLTWNKLSAHLNSIGRTVIKPGSTVSEVLLASHKSSLLMTDFSSYSYVGVPWRNTSFILRGISGARKIWV